MGRKVGGGGRGWGVGGERVCWEEGWRDGMLDRAGEEGGRRCYARGGLQVQQDSSVRL